MIFAVIGDIVASRELPDRAGAHDRLGERLADVDALIPSVDGLAATVGDEFQGVYRSLSHAVAATLLARLALAPIADTRYGIGCGRREVLDATRIPPLQDGSAWWSARRAIDALAAPAARSRRGWYDDRDAGPGAAGVDAAWVNAQLLCRDALVDRLGERARAMLLQALGGASQREIAATEGISPSAVSQQFARGIAAVRDAHLLLVGLTRSPMR